MKLATYRNGDGYRVGIIAGDRLIDAQFDGGMIALIQQWDELLPRLAALESAGGGVPLSSAELWAPVPRPGKIFALGMNYADHIAEMGREPPERQVWFTKAQTSVNGPFAPILIARGSTATDYEVELVAVIGRAARYVSAEHAADHVFGYCVGNDVTERHWQRASPQWALGKSFDSHAPMGPWLTTADELGDPHRLGIRCSVNGEVRQNSNTRHLIFNVWQQIEHLSAAMTLEPGDVIFTGTPAGVGMGMDPPCFLAADDVVRSEIDGLGAIEARMVQDA